MFAPPAPLSLVVLDWAGTTIDFGSFASLETFVELFGRRNVHISPEEVRGPMGAQFKDHLRLMLAAPAIAARWEKVLGRQASKSDFSQMFDALVPIHLVTLERHCELTPGLLGCVAELRGRGLKVAGSTAYFWSAAERCAAAAARQGFRPDANISGDDVPASRPAPWMIFRAMETLGVYPPSAVVKVGATCIDVTEGRNAGVWTVSVVDSGNEMGLTRAEFAALSVAELQKRRQAAAVRLRAVGAHYVIWALDELPSVIDEIQRRRIDGESPG